MNIQIGRATDVGVAKESTRGTGVAPTNWVPFLNFQLDEQIEQVIDESSVSRIEDSLDAVVTEKFAEGSLESRIQSESIGLFLLATLGEVATVVDTPEAGVNTHTFSVANNAQHPSLTISVKDGQGDKEFVRAMINSLELALELNSHAKFTAEIRSEKSASATLTSSYSADDEKKVFLPQHGTFKVATDLAGLGAGTEHLLRSISLSISKNLEDDQVIGSLDPNDILNKQFAVEGSVELLYRDTTFIDDLLSDTKKAVRLTMANTDVVIGAVSNPSIQIDLANVKFGAVGKPYSNNDLVVQTVEFKAFYSLTDAQMIEIALVNETVAY